MLLQTQMHQGSMDNLKSQIDNKIERILWMVRNGKGTNTNKKKNLNRTIGVQTYFHDSHHKDSDSTFLTSKDKQMDSLDISDFSDVKEHPRIAVPHYGKSYTASRKIQTRFPYHKVSKKLLQDIEGVNEETDRSNVSSKLDTHNLEFEQQIKKRKNSTAVQKPRRNVAVNPEIFREMEKLIQNRQKSKREELPLTNFVRDRLLKRVFQISQKQEIVET